MNLQDAALLRERFASQYPYMLDVFDRSIDRVYDMMARVRLEVLGPEEEEQVEEEEAPEPSRYITDAGQLLPGARKHRWKPGGQITVKDIGTIEEHPEGVGYKYVTKPYVFGPFPWAAEQAAGVEPGAAVYKEALWRAVAARPFNTAESRRAYVTGADWLKGQLSGLKTAKAARDFPDQWRRALEGKVLTAPMSAAELVDRLGLTLPYLSAPVLGRQTHEPYSGAVSKSKVYDIVGLEPVDVRTRLNRLNIRRFRARQDQDMELFRKLDEEKEQLMAPFVCKISQADLESRGYSGLAGGSYEGGDYQLVTNESDPVPLQSLLALAGTEDDSLYYGKGKPPLINLVLGRWPESTVGRSRSADWDQLLGRGKRTGGSTGPVWQRATTEQRREGPSTEQPLNIGEALIERYGFTGDQFGEWVTQNERKEHRKLAWDAFFDLADVIGLPPKQIGLGRLGIAFGARGSGRASAHYESINSETLKYLPVINLTNTRGDGSLAHEWGHFLDHHLSADPSQVRTGPDNAVRALFATETGSPLVEGVMNAIMTPSVPVSLRDERNSISDETNAVAKELNHLVRTGQITRAEYNLRWDAMKADRKHRLKHIGESQYYRDATAIGDGYWNSRVELFARAFESWVEDELIARDRVNTYLVYGTRKKYQITRKGQTGLEPYPQGAERERIGAEFRKLMEVVAGLWQGASVVR